LSHTRHATLWLALAGALSVGTACASGPSATASPAANAGGYDAAAAADQARTFHTMATTNEWGNYGEQFTRFCTVKFGFDCNREDRDLGEGSLTSAQEVQLWDAERNNPTSVLADIGILFIPQAQEIGILADYQPPNANLLPDEFHGPGWVATFVGVPTMLVNVGFLESNGLPIPDSWADLADPAYADPPLVGMSRPGSGSSSTWAFVSMNLAAGGSLENWQPGIDYGKRLLPNITQQATIDTFERGEVPIAVRFDFLQTAWFEELTARGVDYSLVVPSDTAVYAPTTLMMNRFDVAHDDFAKMFMEWVLTDEGQLLFSKFGARPIRSVVGENRIVVPDELRQNWQPDEEYSAVQSVDWRQIDSEAILDLWENQVVGAN
jgi:putative spermidine/putrescine transport system substrate-binding protein